MKGLYEQSSGCTFRRRPVLRVSSHSIKSTSRSTRIARSVMSSMLPMGVPTRYKVFGCSDKEDVPRPAGEASTEASPCAAMDCFVLESSKQRRRQHRLRGANIVTHIILSRRVPCRHKVRALFGLLMAVCGVWHLHWRREPASVLGGMCALHADKGQGMAASSYALDERMCSRWRSRSIGTRPSGRSAARGASDAEVRQWPTLAREPAMI
eukprot:scaffold897_cov402-Prasinococcus_capsulatus_cf.AAC.71